MGRLTGRVCLLTGGARGLGAVFARALAGEGARVALADVADGAALAEEIGGIYLPTDVSDPGAARRAVVAAEGALGPLTILVNNAAIFSTLPMARYDRIDPDLWDSVMAVNVRGAFNMVQAAAPGMEARGYGKIVNITSGTVMKGMPGMLHYVASKGALAAMTRCLSRELGPSGVRVNSLSPGLTLSDSILANEDHIARTRDRVLASRAIARDGQPEDLIGAMIFLCSGESDFVTGQTLAVDGGSVNT